MKKLLILMLVLSLGLMFIGCSDDDDDNTPAVTRVSIKNSTSADIQVLIDDVDGTITAGETWSYTFNSEMFVNEDEIPVDYTVTGLYVATTERTVTVLKNQTTPVDIVAEGGIITLRNDYYFAIDDVRIYTNNANTGANLISTPLATGDSIVVLKDAATYTIQIRLSTEEIEFMNNVQVTDNQTTSVVYDKHVFSATNNTASGISYRLDNESLSTIAASESIERELGEDFADAVEFYYNGLYIFDQTINLDFDAQSYYHFDLDAQGGAIFVVNNTSDNITEVYISPSSSSSWGPDYMPSTITPGNQFAWTVQEGLWDVKIVDDAGFEAEIYEIQINLNESEYVDYGDDKKTRKTSTSLKNKAHYNFPLGGTKVEAN
ncbi:hypothetical protein JEZ13_10140 [bacterium]|nr:hypothetical protein [bacterium]